MAGERTEQRAAAPAGVGGLRRETTAALMAGNFMIGLSILAPAGMIGALAEGFGVTVARAGLVITVGAIVLCLGSPLVAWATNAIDRRRLLTVSLILLALGHVASAFAPDLTTLILARMVSMVGAAIFTPQAASTIAMLVSERQRPAAIALVFSGWSLSVAVGLPLVAWAVSQVDWRTIYSILALFTVAAGAAVWATIPRGLRAPPMGMASWGVLLTDRLVIMLVLATALSAAGQFVVFTYFGPLLTILTGATGTTIASIFAVFGVSGFVGTLAASRFVPRLGAYRMSLFCFALMVAGSLVWSVGAGALPVMAIGGVFWGLGFASSNSMQQARLATAVPALAGAAVALNSSAVYVGQAVGSALGGALFDAGHFLAMGYVAAAFLLATLGVVALTRPGAAGQ